MKKPYLKKYSKISDKTVWIVDGKYIRGKLDEEFTSFGHHLRFKFIPKNEFWIDKEANDGEEQFYIDHMLVENRLMEEGKSYEEAADKADKKEQKERKRSKLANRFLQSKIKKDAIIKKIHKKLLKKYSKKIKVWVVNGELVRDLLFVEFTEGGHDKVYSFVPKNEIWIDDDVSKKEIKYILLHEMHERNLMCKGWSYDGKKSAHKSSSEIEYFCRNHPNFLDKKLKKELEISLKG